MKTEWVRRIMALVLTLCMLCSPLSEYLSFYGSSAFAEQYDSEGGGDASSNYEANADTHSDDSGSSSHSDGGSSSSERESASSSDSSHSDGGSSSSERESASSNDSSHSDGGSSSVESNDASFSGESFAKSEDAVSDGNDHSDGTPDAAGSDSAESSENVKGLSQIDGAFHNDGVAGDITEENVISSKASQEDTSEDSDALKENDENTNDTEVDPAQIEDGTDVVSVTTEAPSDDTTDSEVGETPAISGNAASEAADESDASEQTAPAQEAAPDGEAAKGQDDPDAPEAISQVEPTRNETTTEGTEASEPSETEPTGEVPAEGVVPAEGAVPAEGVVPAEGAVPAEGVVPAEGAVPMEDEASDAEATEEVSAEGQPEANALGIEPILQIAPNIVVLNTEAAGGKVPLGNEPMLPDGASNDGSDTSKTALQYEVDEALNKIVGKLSGRVQVILTRSTTYEGDTTIKLYDREVADDFELEISAEDAGTDGMQGEGRTFVDGEISIYGIKVIMNSIIVNPDKTISVRNGGELVFTGSKLFPNEMSILVGDKSKATITTTDDDDIINLETEQGAESVKISTGDGFDAVNAKIYGGKVDIQTGFGEDRLDLTVSGDIDSLNVDTGDSADKMKITNNGRAEHGVNILTGEDDDQITIDNRDKAGSIVVDSGKGSDTVEIYKGDHYTLQSVDYDQYITADESPNASTDAVVKLKGSDRTDCITIDASTALAVKGIQIEGEGASVYLKGRLAQPGVLQNLDNPITSILDAAGKETGFRLHTTLDSEVEKQDYTLDVNLGANIFTDTLENKKTVELYASGDTFTYDKANERFVNYVLKTPTQNLKKITITGADHPLTLTNFVLDADETQDNDDRITVNDLTAENLNVVFLGKTIDINGNVRARNVRAESAQGTLSFAQNWARLGEEESFGEFLANMFSIKDTATINVNPGANIHVDEDVDLVARVKQTGGISTLLPASINVFNLKLADARINIADGATIQADAGHVSALAKLQTTVGYQYDEEKQTETVCDIGMPVAVMILDNDAVVNVARGATIRTGVVDANGKVSKTGADIVLHSQSDVKIATYAKSYESYPSPIDIAASIIINTVKTRVDGTLRAGNKAQVSAVGSVKEETVATSSFADGALSGGYVAVSVVDQNVDAIVGDSAVIDAGGNVRVVTNAFAFDTTKAISAEGQPDEKKTPTIKEALKTLFSSLLKVGLNKAKDYYEGAEGLEKKLKKMLGDVAENDITVHMAKVSEENDAKGSATITTEDDVGEDGSRKVIASVSVEPVNGCLIKEVSYRYLKPGEDHYTYVNLMKSETGMASYANLFDVPAADVEIIVRYLGEPDGAAEDGERDDQNGQNAAGDREVNIGDLVDDVAEGAGNPADDWYLEREAQDEEEVEVYDLVIRAMNNGAVVTWNTDGDSASLNQVYAGEKVRLVPNPSANYILTEDSLTITYKVSKNTEVVTKTDIVAKDGNGQYIFTVPEGLLDDRVEVNAKFEEGGEEKEQQVRNYQATGAIAVGILNNDNQSVIEKGAQVNAGGIVNLVGFKMQRNMTTADGTAVEAKAQKKKNDDKPKPFIYSNYGVSGAEFALNLNSNVKGYVTGTTDREVNENASNYHPVFTMEKDKAEKLQTIRISYYTKLEGPDAAIRGFGTRRTLTLTRQPDGTYTEEGGTQYWADTTTSVTRDDETESIQMHLTGLAVMNGTTMDVSFVFDDGGVQTAGSQEYLITNPIQISYNKLKDKDKNVISMGTVTYDHQKDGRYYFRVEPDKDNGYTIDDWSKDELQQKLSNIEALYASWVGADGKVQKTYLMKDIDDPLHSGNNVWYFEPEEDSVGVPDGAVVTINAVFREDLREIRKADDYDPKEGHGDVTIKKNKLRKGEKVELTLKADEGYVANGVTVKYYEPGTLTWKTLDAARINLDQGTGKATFIMPLTSDADTSHVSITPSFTRKDVELGKAMTDAQRDDFVFSEKDGYSYLNGQVTVSPSDKKIKEGYKVTSVTVKNSDGLTRTFKGKDSFTISEDMIVEGNKFLEISVEMERKAIKVNAPETENGKISPVSDYADSGEKVLVEAKPEKGYRVKQGTFKAVVATGTESKQVMVRKDKAGNYYFNMPSGVDGNANVTLLCTFEPGSDEVEMSLGASVAVGVLTSDNEVEIRGGNVSAAKGFTIVGVSAGGKATTEALAGYSAGNMGIAGALAVQVNLTNNNVAIRKDDNGSITLETGNFFMLSKGKLDIKLTADAAGKKTPEAKNTGVGAGIAVGVNNMNVLGAIEDGVRMVRYGQDRLRETGTDVNGLVPVITGININVGQKYKDVTTAKAGAAGGTAWVPVAAVDVTNVTSRAVMGRLDLSPMVKDLPIRTQSLEKYSKLREGVIPVTGKVKIKSTVMAAKTEYNHDITADAASRGGSTAVGGAFAVSWAKDSSEATLNQSLNGSKDIIINAINGSALKSVANAAVSGGVKSQKGDADKQGNGLLGSAGNIAGKYGGMDANAIKNDANGRQKAETAETSVAAAGAFVLNMQNSFSQAEVKGDTSVTTKGKLEVKALNRTEATLKANASATKSDTGVGVGVAINVVNMDNIARVGSGKIEANELEVSANIAPVPGRLLKWTVYSNTTTVRTALRNQIEQALGEVIEQLGPPYDELGKDFLARPIASFAATMADKLLLDLGLEKLVSLQAGDGLDAAFANAGETMIKRLDNFCQTLAAPFVNVFEEVSETFGCMDSEEDWEMFYWDALGTATTEIAGDAWQTLVNDIIKDGGNAVLGSAINMVADKVSGKGWSADTLKKNLKDSLSKAMDNFLDRMVTTIIDKMSDRITVLTQGNIERAKEMKQELKRLFKEAGVKAVVTDLWRDIDKTFREQVYDYEKYLIKFTEGDFVKNVKKELLACLRDSATAMSNEVLDAFASNLDVVFEREPRSDRHIITTEAISGAGGADKSGAGSLAIAVAHLNTVAEIKDGSQNVKVTGTMGVTADEVRRVRTWATAAVDSRGEAETKEEGGEEDNDIDESGVTHVTTPDCNVTVDVGVGGTAEFDRLTAANQPKVWLTPGLGYKLTDGTKLNGTYKEPESDDEHEFTATVHEENGKFYIMPLEDIDETRDIDDTIDIAPNALIVDVPIVFEEDLKELVVQPTAVFDYDDNASIFEEDVLFVSVEDREIADDKLQARPGETVELTMKRDDVQLPEDKVKNITVKYIDAQNEEKELTLEKNQIVRTTSNKNEIKYIFIMPDGEVTDIVFTFEKGQEDYSDTDASGRKIGVGAGFALTYGKSETRAQIGAREGGVEAGSLAVVANEVNEQENYSTAGTDPFQGTGTSNDPDELNAEDSDKVNEKDLGVDASVSVYILDNDVIASIANGTKVTTTADPKAEFKASWNVNGDAGEEGSKRAGLTSGGVVVQALEQGSSETKANAFATGSTSAIGATVAVNVSLSDVKAEVGGAIDAKGALTVNAGSLGRDRTWAFATALGAEVQRALNKFADGTEKVSEKATDVTTGKFFDDLSKENKKKGKKGNDTSKRITDRLNDGRVKDKDGDEADENLSVSTNVLRTQNARVDKGEDANDAAKDAAKEANDAADRDDIQLNDRKEESSKLQVAAAVGVTVALHTAAVTVSGAVDAGGDVMIVANNSGNFNTRSTAASMSVKESKGNVIAAAVGVSVNSDKATVEVRNDVKSKGNVRVGSSLTMNTEDEFVTRLPVQALSGSVSGKGATTSIGGAVAAVVSHAVSKAEVTGAQKISGNAVTVMAYDKSKLGARAGGVNVSKGANVGIGVSAAVLYSDNEVKASVNDGADIEAQTFELSAIKKAITWEDFQLPWKKSDVFTDSTYLTDEQRSSVTTGLIDIHREVDDYGYNYHVDVNLDTYKLMKLFDAGNMLAFNNYYTAAIAGSLVTGAADEKGSANAFNGAGSFSIVRTDNRVNAILGKNVNIHTPESGGGVDGVKIAAEDTSTARLVGGAIAAGTARYSAGVTVTFLKDGDHAKAEVGDNATINAKNVSIETIGDTQVQALNAAATVNASDEGKLSIGGAANLLLLKNEAETAIGNNVSITSDNALDIKSKSDMDLLLVSAGIAGAGRGVTVGGTVAYIDDEASSKVTVGNNHTLTADKGDVNLSAVTTDHLFSVLASASAAFSSSGAAAGAVNLLKSATKGNVALGSGGANHGVTSKQGDVSIIGHTDTRAINVTTSAAGSRGMAIGMSVNVNRFNRESIVDIAGGDGYTITAAKNVLTEAYGNDTTIMAGLAVAGSTRGLSLSGNLPLLFTTNTVKTRMGAGNVTAGGEAAFSAHLADHTYSIAGSIALSNRASAVGATLMILKRQNEVTTDMGTSTVRADGGAGTLRDKLVGKPKFKGVYVGATAEDTTIAGAAGIALAEDIGITGNLISAINSNTVKADASKAKLNAINQVHTSGGFVTVDARDDSHQVIIAGGVNFGKLIGAGASVVNLTANKRIDALMGQAEAYEGVNVTADNKDKIFELAVNGGFSQVLAVGIGAAVQSMDSRVNAIVDGTVNAKTGGVAINANNTADMVNTAVAVAGAETTAAAPVGAITVYRGQTNAILKGGVVNAAGAVDVKANAKKTMQTYTIGGAGSTEGLALSGALTINSLKDVTRAQVLKDAAVYGEGTMDVIADSSYEDTANSAALGVGATSAAAVNAMVSVIKGATLAEVDGRVSLVNDKLNIRAISDRDIDNGVLAVGAGFGGVGAGVTLMGVFVGDKLSQDAADLLVYGNAEKKTEENKVFNVDGFVKQIKKAGVDVSALEHKDNADGTVQTSLAEDLAGDGHSDSAMNVGKDGKFDAASGMVDTSLQNAQGSSETVSKEETEDIKNARKLGDYTSTEQPTDAIVARIGENGNAVAVGIDVIAQQETKANLFGVAVGAAADLGVGISAGVAKLRSNVLAASEGRMNARNSEINIKAISRAGSVDTNASSEEQARASELNKRLGEKSLGDNFDPDKRGIRIVGVAAGGSIAAGMAASIAGLRADNVTKAIVGGNVNGVSRLNVDAQSDYDNVLTATVGAAGSGTFSAAVSVALAVANGEVESRLASDAHIVSNLQPEINVTTHSVTGANAIAASVAGSGGAAFAGGIAVASNSLRQTTSVDRGAYINANYARLNVQGNSTTTADTWLLGVAGAPVAIGLNAAVSKVKPTMNTTVGINGDGVVSLGRLYSVNINNDARSNATANVLSLSGGAKSLQGNLLLVFNESDAAAKLANITAIELGAVNVNGDLAAKGDATLLSANVGAVAGGISVSYVDVDSKNRAIVDTDNINVTGQIDRLRVTTGANGNNKTEATTGALTMAIGGMAAGINASIARNRAQNLAEISGNKGLSVMNGIDLKSNAVGNAKADIIGMNIGLASVAASVAVASNEATAKAGVKLKGDLIGELNADASVTGETTAEQKTGGGALLDIKTNVAAAYGRTNALVDVDLSEPTGAVYPFRLNATVHGGNKVTTDVQNQSFGVISAAGVGGVAQSEDIYRARVMLSKGGFQFGDINVITEYEADVDARVTPSAAGMDINIVKAGYNSANARTKTTAGSELVIDGAKLTMNNADVNVNTKGKATANAEIKSAKFVLGAVNVGVSKSEAEMSAVQAATLRLKDGSIDGVRGLNVSSLVNKATADASIGTSGVTDEDRGEVKIGFVNGESNISMAREKIDSIAAIEGESGSNTIKAAYMDVISGVADGVTTRATGRSDGAANVGLVTLGNLDASAHSTDSFNTTLRGVNADIAGAVNVKARTNTSAEGIGFAPGNLSIINAGMSEVSAFVGDESDRQTAKVLIGDDVKLRSGSGSINVNAQNEGSANAYMKSRGQYSVASLSSSSQPTHSWYDTGIVIGDRVELDGKGGLKVASNTASKALSTVDADALGLVLNAGTMKGENHVHEVNSLMVGMDSKLTSGGDIDLNVGSKTNAEASTAYQGGFGIIGDMGVHADTEIERDAAILIKDNATIESTRGSVNIVSTVGKGDNITNYATQRVSKAVEWGKSYSNVNSKVNNTVSIGGAVNIIGKNDVNIQALTTGVGENGWARGYDVYSEVNASGLKLDTAPDAYATINLDFNTAISINRDGWGNPKWYTNINSQSGQVDVKTSNDKLISGNVAGARGGGLFGNVTGSATTNANITNLIWVDGANFNGAKGTQLRANFGDGYMGRAEFTNTAYAHLDGIGPDKSNATLAGAMKAEIRTNSRYSVNGGNNFTHKATTDMYALLVAEDTKSKAVKVSSVCDFCLGKDAYHDDTTRDNSSGDIDNALRRLSRLYGNEEGTANVPTIFEDAMNAGFKKALAVLDDIQSTVDTFNTKGITKARYGKDEENLAAGAIYVVDVHALLNRDARMTRIQLGNYRLWTNAATQADVYLMPNAARLMLQADGQMEYVTDVLMGDPLNDGRSHYIDIITALTGNAIANPAIPFGSAGYLDFATGTLSVPEDSDMELYLHEISAKWLLDSFESGFFRMLQSDQATINVCALNGNALPQGNIVEKLTEDGEVDGWKRYWIGPTPEMAQSPDQTLVFLMVNEETDEVDAFRTSVSALEKGEQPMDVSLYLYRDSKSDRRGEERYNTMFFDTPNSALSLVKVVTNVLEYRPSVLPKALNIVLRRFDLDGADLPGFSIADYLYAMSDGTDGFVSMFGGYYVATIADDTFDSAYTRIEGISGSDPTVIIKADQSVWPTWTGKDTAEDLNGKTYHLEDDSWYADDAPTVEVPGEVTV